LKANIETLKIGSETSTQLSKTTVDSIVVLLKHVHAVAMSCSGARTL